VLVRTEFVANTNVVMRETERPDDINVVPIPTRHIPLTSFSGDMNRETPLAAAAAGVVAVALLLAAAVPGVVAEPRDDPIHPGYVDVSEVTIEAGEVAGATADLRVTAYVSHRGNPTRNVSVLFRAVDAESGLVATTERVDVEPLTDDREVTANATLSVEREGGYRIETILYRDGERVDAGVTRVSGLEALTPAYARTSVAFADSEVLPPLSVSVADVRNNRTTLAVAASLTNEGDTTAADDLRVTLVLRQAESNLVADRASVPVGRIRQGRTETVEAELTVPTGYNYYVDAILWKDGVMVDAARGVANLDPTERISADTTVREVELDVSDFETDGDAGGARGETDVPATSMQTPGFGVGIAAVALIVSALFARGRIE
jgi:hypothetical protein